MKELVEVIAKALVDNPDAVVRNGKGRGRRDRSGADRSIRPIWERSSASREESQKRSVLL